MQRFLGLIGIAIAIGFAGHASALDITPDVQQEIERQIEVVKSWAADPAVVQAVVAHNDKGPLAGMDNAKWKTVRRSEALVKAFQSNPAALYLQQQVKASGEMYSEAFLNGGGGEKVAFVEKPSSYIHKGQAKFDVPFGSGKAWQGKPEFDESSQTHQIQVSVPVLSHGKAVGALVVGLNLTRLEKMARK
jgi:hypothetical protein